MMRKRLKKGFVVFIRFAHKVRSKLKEQFFSQRPNSLPIHVDFNGTLIFPINIANILIE